MLWSRPKRLAHAALLTAAAFLTLCPQASLHAQGRGPGGSGPGGGGPGGGMGSPGMSHGPFGGNLSLPNTRNSQSPDPEIDGRHSRDSTLHGGLQLGPPGRWWDDKHFAESIGLDSTQQHRMDDVFSANKSALVNLFKNLQHEESKLGKVVRARELNEAEIFEQIDRVAQARGELEKANAHMLLQIRKEMSPEQTARLDDRRPSQ